MLTEVKCHPEWPLLLKSFCIAAGHVILHAHAKSGQQQSEWPNETSNIKQGRYLHSINHRCPIV